MRTQNPDHPKDEFLREEEERFRVLFESTPDAIFIESPDGIVLDVNQAACKLHGMSREELIGKDAASLVPEWHRLKDLKADLAVVHNEARFESYSLKKDGTIVPVEIRSTSIVYENESALLLTVRDITERRVREQRITVLQTAVDQAAGIVVITDRAGNIEYVNPAFSKITGYSAEEVIGKSTRILNSGYFGKEYYRSLWDTVLKGEEWHGEFRNRKKSGELYWEAAVISPVRNYKNEITHFIALKTDITRKKNAEEGLYRSVHVLEELNKSKDKFLSIIAHDLRNPFNGIIGLMRTLLDDLDSYSTDTLREYLKLILISATNAYTLLEDLLEWSCLRMGKTAVAPECIDIPSFAEEIASEVTASASEKNIALSIDASFRGTAYADKHMMKAVLRNLLSNAIKFTNRGGAVFVHFSEYDGRVRVAVEDTGIGMDGEAVKTILENDLGFSTKGTEGEKGTGLGLKLCREFLESNASCLSIQSEKGKGTVVSFLLPMLPPQEADSG